MTCVVKAGAITLMTRILEQCWGFVSPLAGVCPVCTFAREFHVLLNPGIACLLNEVEAAGPNKSMAGKDYASKC